MAVATVQGVFNEIAVEKSGSCRSEYQDHADCAPIPSFLDLVSNFALMIFSVFITSPAKAEAF